ncbi:MAG: hypothetical protein IT388_11900 [Nitrospirales bacterium]|nr:hypothetical protein [Nitrospirales bacterium]
MNREKFKLIGFYVLAVLILVRFVIVPYRHALEEKRTLLGEYTETYRMRAASLERFREGEKAKSERNSAAETSLLKSVFPRTEPYASLQAELVREITTQAEKEELTVLNFEFPDPVLFKTISEVTVVIRLKGEQKGVVALLREMEKADGKYIMKRFENARSGQDTLCSMTVSAFRREK